jgi:hypothetical protein
VNIFKRMAVRILLAEEGVGYTYEAQRRESKQ